MTTAPSLTSPAPPSGPALSSRADRFFSWTAGLGVVRGEGWIGGVAAGLAARVGIDPLIVRGILIVLGVFAFPVILLYGVAWALLPDLDGRIPLQRLFQGRFEASQVGVAVFLLVGLVPFPLFAWGSVYGMITPAGIAVAAAVFILGLVIAGSFLFLIVRAASGNPGGSVGEAPPEAEPEADAVVTEPAGGDASDSPPTADGDLEAWKEQHAAWKEQDQAWRRQQQDAARAAREQARRERQARATAFAAEAADRRRLRRQSAPRTPFAYVAVSVGLALVVGTVAALQQSGSLAVARGVLVGAAILAASMVLAGALRRRSGFLACATLVTLLGGGAALGVPTVMALHPGSYGISNVGSQTYPASAPFTQPWGDLTVTLDDTGTDRAMWIEKREGSTWVSIAPGVEVTLELTTDRAAPFVSGSYVEQEPLADLPGTTVDVLTDGRTRYRAVVTGVGPVTTRQAVTIDQDAGYVELYQFDPSPEPSDASTEGAGE